MRVLMLGWEYPPHIAGGLGIACEGLTKALARTGVDILFCIPELGGGEEADHMVLVDPVDPLDPLEEESLNEKIERTGIPTVLKPYWSPEDYEENRKRAVEAERRLAGRMRGVLRGGKSAKSGAALGFKYGRDLFEEINRYTANVVAHLSNQKFDLIHAHDWMTYSAGVALAQRTGKPLICHVHSLEYDRSGAGVNSNIYEIEGMGLRAADAVVAVSHYTKGIIQQQHSIPASKIHVVHNGIYPKDVQRHYDRRKVADHKIVLFLGRMTFQKGPDYFVRAAEQVIPLVPDVMFVMAGAGDMFPQIVEMVHYLGLQKHFHFTGFLRGAEVEKMFSVADLYVMPSVSEPFGISALEAINFNVPALISKQSGVAEVLGHALKFDFWDVNRLADLIVNGLNSPELRQDMVAQSKQELRKLRWDASAVRTNEVYQHVLERSAKSEVEALAVLGSS